METFAAKWNRIWTSYGHAIESVWAEEALCDIRQARSCSEAIRGALWLLAEANHAHAIEYLWEHDLAMCEYERRGIGPHESQAGTAPPQWQRITIEQWKGDPDGWGQGSDGWADLALMVLSAATDVRRLGRLLLVLQDACLVDGVDGLDGGDFRWHGSCQGITSEL